MESHAGPEFLTSKLIGRVFGPLFAKVMLTPVIRLVPGTVIHFQTTRMEPKSNHRKITWLRVCIGSAISFWMGFNNYWRSETHVSITQRGKTTTERAMKGWVANIECRLLEVSATLLCKNTMHGKRWHVGPITATPTNTCYNSKTTGIYADCIVMATLHLEYFLGIPNLLPRQTMRLVEQHHMTIILLWGI